MKEAVSKIKKDVGDFFLDEAIRDQTSYAHSYKLLQEFFLTEEDVLTDTDGEEGHIKNSREEIR